MFDLVTGSVDRPFRDSHTAAAAGSAAIHVAVLGAVAWAVLFSVADTLPKVPTMMAFVVAAPPAPPPPAPPPPPAAPAAKASQPSKPAPTLGTTFVAPAAIPVGIQPEPLFDAGDEGGVVGGVEGGIAGGILGGVLGGMVTEVMPAPTPPRPAKPVRVGGGLQAPALIHRVEPEYPGVAVSARVTGIVVLEATVDETGKVTDVAVVRSITLLDAAAIKAVKQWRYQPLLLNGTAVPFVVTVTLTFSIRER